MYAKASIWRLICIYFFSESNYDMMCVSFSSLVYKSST